MMGRREFMLLGGAAAAWPLAAWAQQRERMRRIGVLLSTVESDPTGLEYITAFAQGLAELGWTVGRNVRIDTRWAAADADRIRKYAEELVALAAKTKNVSADGPSIHAPRQAHDAEGCLCSRGAVRRCASVITVPRPSCSR